jgi:hypothetical protein
MRPFTYERADDVQTAVRAVSGRPDAKFIAGGTNLLDLMKLQIETPAHLVDVNRLPLAGSGGGRGPRIGHGPTAPWPTAVREKYRCSARPCWLAPRANFAIRRPPAATRCNGPAASTSTNWDALQQARARLRAAPFRGSIASTRSSARARPDRHAPVRHGRGHGGAGCAGGDRLRRRPDARHPAH